MRLLLAGCLVWGAALLAITLLGALHLDHPVVVSIVVVVVSIVTTIAVMAGLNPPARRPAAAAVLVESHYTAKRALQVEESEDEGLHYFLELENGDVLYLNGQYLYDATNFPSTSFVVRRTREDGYGVDVQSDGQPLPVECVASPFTVEELEEGFVPEDGAVLRDRTFEQWKQQLLARGQ